MLKLKGKSLTRPSIDDKVFEGYKITEDGVVISYKGKTPKVLKLQEDRDGYYKVELYNNHKHKKYFVHRLVAMQYLPNPENKPQINHKNGNKKDNRVENLEWVTRSENAQKAYDNGQQIALGKPKLTREQVLEIRENKDNLNREQLAKRYNVSCGCIQHIKRGRTWKDVMPGRLGDKS